MQRFCGYVVVIFCLVLCLPVWQMAFRYLGELPLRGVEKQSMKVGFSLGKWFSSDWQENFEKRFSEKFGFRGFLVITDNQVNFNLFKEINVFSATKLVLGKDNFLYEKGYVDNFNKRDTISSKQIEEQLELLKKLQVQLAKRNILLVLLISPNKATVYPEYLPNNLIDQSVLSEKTNYQKVIPLLREAGINYFDSVDFLLKNKSNYPFTLFTKGGTHWSSYSACLVDKNLLKYLENIGTKTMPDFGCDPYVIDNSPVGTDKDLAALTNIWNENIFFNKTAHPSLLAVDQNAYHPKVLFVGDSFVWTVMDIFEKKNFFTDRDFLYYDELNYSGQGNTTQGVKRITLSLEKLLLTKDLVIIEVNEVGFDNVGFGFVKRALDFLSTY